MASSYERPLPPPSKEEQQPGELTAIGQHVLQKGAELMQSLAPVRRMKPHACRFALYSPHTRRQIETHHYLAWLNQDFLQCPVYDADDNHARLIGVEYIISERVFETLPSEEPKLWHSHAYEIKSGLWIHPRVPDFGEKVELRKLAKTYGKFWCTWQVDRGNKLPMGAPALMTSPQPSGWGLLKPDVVMKRDNRYGIRTDQLKATREDIEVLLDMYETVVQTSDHCSAHLGYQRPTSYMPHLSLLYGDLTDEEKKKAQEKANDLDRSLNGLSFLISRLALYKTDLEDKTCQSWEKIAECSLNTS